MKPFWHFARLMLRQRRRLAIGFSAAVLDALCAFAGFGTLLLVVRDVFGTQRTVRDMLAAQLDNDLARWLLGDTQRLVELVPGDLFSGFATALGVILVLTIVGSTMRFIHQAAVIAVVLRTTMQIRQRAFHRLVHAPLETVMSSGTADNLSRLVRDCTQLGGGLNALMGKAVRDVLMGLVFLGMALLFDPLLTGIFLIGLPLIYVCIRKFGKRVRRASRGAFEAYGWMVGAVQESMQALPVVKVHGAEGYERRRFNTINRRVFQQEMKARMARALSSPVIETIAIIGVMAVSLVAAWYVFTPGATVEPGDMLMVLIALIAAGASFRPLANLNNQLQESAAAAARVHEVLHLPVEPNTRGSHALNLPRLPRHHRDIHFQSVSYAYPGSDRSAIRAIDLHVRHGQVTAIVGPNGSGKSTLLNLLPRLVDPTDGRVLIDGTDIAAVNLRTVRKQIAVVTQQTILFEGTIAENIAYGRRYTSQADIEQAARAAFAHDFIVELPHGYNTVLGEAGSGLSGGQKQRLAIARAILRDPAILILDEATSQVDAQSEAKINRALAQFRRGRTTFVIAHRLSTVIDADCIVVMLDGQIEAQGAHAALLQQSDTYRMLTQTQLQASAAVE